jgi:hypothetical protein
MKMKNEEVIIYFPKTFILVVQTVLLWIWVAQCHKDINVWSISDKPSN